MPQGPISLQYTGTLPPSLNVPFFTIEGSRYWPQTPGNVTPSPVIGSIVLGAIAVTDSTATLTSLTWGIGGATSTVNFSSASGITSLSLPMFQLSGGALTIQLAGLTSLLMPNFLFALSTAAFNSMASLTSISLPSLEFFGGTVTVSGCSSLTTVSFPGVVNIIGNITMNSGNGALQNVILGTPGITKAMSASINISSQALTAASVNRILALLVSLDGTNGTTLWGSGRILNVSGGTSSAPTGQGVTDKATLQARGTTITTN